MGTILEEIFRALGYLLVYLFIAGAIYLVWNAWKRRSFWYFLKWTLPILLISLLVGYAVPTDDIGKKFEIGVLTLTALAVSWYSFETFRLREQALEANRIQIRPLLEPKLIRQKSSSQIDLYLRNLGRREARDFQWWLVEVDGNIQRWGVLQRVWPSHNTNLYLTRNLNETERYATLQVRYSWDWGAGPELENENFNLALLEPEDVQIS